MSPVRVGFIGTGHITTRSHLPALMPLVESGEVVLQSFCDRDRENLEAQAAEFGVPGIYDEHHEMLEKEELDALYVTIPPTLHTDAEILAAEKGIALFVEKPPTLDLQQAVGFSDAIEKAGIVSAVGFMSRYYPAAEEMRRIVAGRTVRHANGLFFYSGRPVRHWTNRMELCGGSLAENGIHRVDLLRYLLDDDYESVSAFYYDRPHDPDPKSINLPYVYNVNYRMKGGPVANFTTSRVLTNTRASRRELLIIADDSLLEFTESRIVENGEVVWESTEKVNPFGLQAKCFMEAVRAGDPSMVRSPYREALNSLAAVLRANESAKAGGKTFSLELLAGASSASV